MFAVVLVLLGVCFVDFEMDDRVGLGCGLCCYSCYMWLITRSMEFE